MSLIDKDGGPAFAAMAIAPAGDVYHSEGMTLRDWFAGQALAGLSTLDADCGPMGVAHDAYRYAEAMLKTRAALTKEGGE